MINYCIANLNELRILLEKLSREQYTRPLKLLSGASIGQHVRHILEFYQAVTGGMEENLINYDARERDPALENNIDFTVREMEKISHWLGKAGNNRKVVLNGNFSSEGSTTLAIETSVYRELSYCYEHSIHHQALIKIGLKELQVEYYIDDNFGVAPATVRFKNSCAQ